MRETRGEVDPIFDIILSQLKSLLHKDGLPLPGKTESRFGGGSSGLLE